MAQEREADRTDKARSSDNRSGKGRVSQAGEVAQEAGRQAIDAASALASQATEQVQQAVRRQFRGGADIVEEVADAVRAAGRRLDETMPTAAELARSAARRIDTFADGVRDQSVTELLQGTAKFARRRPGIIFGATALVGFVVLRVLNATPTRQDAEEDRDRNERRDATARDQLGSTWKSQPTTGVKLTGQQMTGKRLAAKARPVKAAAPRQGRGSPPAAKPDESAVRISSNQLSGDRFGCSASPNHQASAAAGST